MRSLPIRSNVCGKANAIIAAVLVCRMTMDNTILPLQWNVATDSMRSLPPSWIVARSLTVRSLPIGWNVATDSMRSLPLFWFVECPWQCDRHHFGGMFVYDGEPVRSLPLSWIVATKDPLRSLPPSWIVACPRTMRSLPIGWDVATEPSRLRTLRPVPHHTPNYPRDSEYMMILHDRGHFRSLLHVL
mgnify:CR=1 FL=1